MTPMKASVLEPVNMAKKKKNNESDFVTIAEAAEMLDSDVPSVDFDVRVSRGEVKTSFDEEKEELLVSVSSLKAYLEKEEEAMQEVRERNSIFMELLAREVAHE